MRDANPLPIHLKEYSPPAFLVSRIALDVDIAPGCATVRGTLEVTRNPSRPGRDPLVLQGENLELVSAAINGAAIEAGACRADERQLVIANVPDRFTLQTVVRFDPWKNTRLEGLYATQTGLVTQCEAEGFRHITYCIDRPDVMSRFEVTICADRARFPRLLANGNLLAQGEGVPEGWFT
jgi:aminopeptidase N